MGGGCKCIPRVFSSVLFCVYSSGFLACVVWWFGTPLNVPGLYIFDVIAILCYSLHTSLHTTVKLYNHQRGLFLWLVFLFAVVAANNILCLCVCRRCERFYVE